MTIDRLNLRHVTQYVATGSLRPAGRILRKHGQKNLKAIEASIRAHGFNNPILVDENSTIICGYGRWLAAKELQLLEVPVICLGHLTPDEIRLYRIADNRIAEQSEFDLTELRLELLELGNLDLNLNLELTGFSTGEIDNLLDCEPAEDNADTLPKLQKVPIIRPGELVRCGDHYLLCGNSLEASSYATLMQGDKAQIVFGDGPYNLKGSAISGSHGDFKMGSGELSNAEFTEFLATVFKHLAANSQDGSIHYQCMDHRHIENMMAAGRQAYDEFKNLAVWAKQSAGMGTFYRSQHELIFIWKSGTASHINNFGLGETGRHRSNLWQYNGNAGFSRNRASELAAHPTVKPWSMVADALRDCSRRGGIILDPFGGYGTTMIAAEKTGRRARLIELDPLYCDASIRRWQELTGRDAFLGDTGLTFNEAADARMPGPEDSEAIAIEQAGDAGAGEGDD